MFLSFLFETPWVYVTGSALAVGVLVALTLLFKCVYYFQKCCSYAKKDDKVGLLRAEGGGERQQSRRDKPPKVV